MTMEAALVRQFALVANGVVEGVFVVDAENADKFLETADIIHAIEGEKPIGFDAIVDVTAMPDTDRPSPQWTVEIAIADKKDRAPVFSADRLEKPFAKPQSPSDAELKALAEEAAKMAAQEAATK